MRKKIVLLPVNQPEAPKKRKLYRDIYAIFYRITIPTSNADAADAAAVARKQLTKLGTPLLFIKRAF